MSLWCTSCGHRHVAETKCCRKWCPACAPKRANERAAKLRAGIRLMKWPLHVTLTVPNIASGDSPKNFIRHLVKSLARLRTSKLWKKNVRGGAASIEVTNKGNGWHPHVHAVIDCRWLALKTPEPHHDDDAEVRNGKFRSAAGELQAAWARATKIEQPTSNWIRRCDHGAAAEIMKYALKSEHVRAIEGPIAPMLRMLDSTRIVTTFGSLRGLKIEKDNDRKLTCPNGHGKWTTTKPMIAIEIEIEERGRIMKLKRDLAKKAAQEQGAAFLRAFNQRDRDRAASRQTT